MTTVDPGHLATVAAQAREVAAAVGAAVADRIDARQVRSGPDGWAAVGAARTASQAWSTALDGLVESLTDFGSALHRAATLYVETDGDNAAQLRKSSAGPG